MENDNELKLPKDKKCEDFIHLKRCISLFGIKPQNTNCDFYPIRFEELENV